MFDSIDDMSKDLEKSGALLKKLETHDFKKKPQPHGGAQETGLDQSTLPDPYEVFKDQDLPVDNEGEEGGDGEAEGEAEQENKVDDGLDTQDYALIK